MSIKLIALHEGVALKFVQALAKIGLSNIWQGHTKSQVVGVIGSRNRARGFQLYYSSPYLNFKISSASMRKVKLRKKPHFKGQQKGVLEK